MTDEERQSDAQESVAGKEEIYIVVIQVAGRNGVGVLLLCI